MDSQRGKGRQYESGVNASGLGRGGPQVTSFLCDPVHVPRAGGGSAPRASESMSLATPKTGWSSFETGAQASARHPVHAAPPATRLAIGQETGPFWVQTLIGSNKSPAVWPKLCPVSPPRCTMWARPTDRAPHGPASPWPRVTPPRSWPQDGCRSVWAGTRRPCQDGSLLGPEYSRAAGQGAGGFPWLRLPSSGLPWCVKE